jgi:hypothetical protein
MNSIAVAKKIVKPNWSLRPRSAPGQASVDAQKVRAGRAVFPFAVANDPVKPSTELRPQSAPGQKWFDAQVLDAGRALLLPFSVAKGFVKPKFSMRPRNARPALGSVMPREGLPGAHFSTTQEQP